MAERYSHKKHYGQHFLHDQNILAKIARSINPSPKDHIIEIGPGQGVLTQHIVDHVKRIDLIEIDRDLVKYLNEHYQQPNLLIHQADILKFDLDTLFTTDKMARIIGNLPYNISTPILFKLCQHASKIQDMLFLLQKEVVMRMCALPNSKEYGRLSIMIQYFCKVKRVMDVPAGAFTPPPKVKSSTVSLIPHKNTPHTANNFEHFEQLVRTAFCYRRKTIHNALKGFIDTSKLASLDINPSLRPENLSLEDYIRISNFFSV
jgi:16S rRNA (adenine1518-N6/adenine1519-N6)-dimethyltransferase